MGTVRNLHEEGHEGRWQGMHLQLQQGMEGATKKSDVVLVVVLETSFLHAMRALLLVHYHFMMRSCQMLWHCQNNRTEQHGRECGISGSGMSFDEQTRKGAMRNTFRILAPPSPSYLHLHLHHARLTARSKMEIDGMLLCAALLSKFIQLEQTRMLLWPN